MSNRTVIGIDHGNGHIKARSDVRTINLPAAYARPEDFASDSLVGDVKPDIQNYTTKSYDGETFVWGSDVAQANALIASYTEEERYTHKPYKVLSEIALSSLIDLDIATGVLVVTGCPSREKGTPMEDDLVRVFRGAHAMTVDGSSRMINVSDVIVLPQPLGTVLNEYLTDDGYVADEAYETEYVGVIDVGSGTTDLDGIRGLKRQSDDTYTFNMGMISAYKQLAKWINAQEPRMNADYKSVERQIREGGTSYARSKRFAIDIQSERSRLFTKLADDLVAGVDNMWTRRSQFDRLLLTGGGACVPEIVAAFKAWQPDIIVANDGQTANANGFFKYAKFKTME